MVPTLFFFVYFRRESLPTKKETVRKGPMLLSTRKKQNQRRFQMARWQVPWSSASERLSV